MKRTYLTILALAVFWISAATVLLPTVPYDDDTPVSSVLIALGDEPPVHYIGNYDMEKVGQGKDMVSLGKAYMPDKTWSKRLSEYFVCTDCHNILPEARYADVTDPAERLAYAMEFNQPYLPGSTLYGITNRTSWFNGDNEKKYGMELIGPARHSLRNAIQLCAKECSVGRELEDWEMDALLNYMNALELKMKDLDLSETELESINARGQSDEEKAANIRLIRSKYIQASGATFVNEKPKETRDMGKKGDMVRGKYIFEKSCLHCHAEDRVTKTVFGHKKGQRDERWLVSYFKKSNGGSVYWITRHGTASKKKTLQYMPIYSKEKLSDAQIEDLAAYLLAESKK